MVREPAAVLSSAREDGVMRVALVVYDGVLDDECEAFRSVLGLMDATEVTMVGATTGTRTGTAGGQTVDVTFDQLDAADVVIVPGGLGCERAADDPMLQAFLQRMGRTARYVAASSTGTVVVAAAGLLHGAPAATHWLADDLLRRYGSESDDRRMVVSGNVITCEGRISALDAAFALVERLQGSSAVDQIRSELLRRGEPLLRERPWWELWLDRFRTRRERPVPGPSTSTPPPMTPTSVMVELVDDAELARRIRRNARRLDRTR
jgi:putative intracellular protease/amidase